LEGLIANVTDFAMDKFCEQYNKCPEEKTYQACKFMLPFFTTLIGCLDSLIGGLIEKSGLEGAAKELVEFHLGFIFDALSGITGGAIDSSCEPK
jgi:hypothetical protein